MGKYTNFFEDMSFDISEEDNYIEEMKRISGLFRTFDKALDSFIQNRGYTGDLSSAARKVEFIKGKFEAKGIPVPRNIKKWYSEHKTIERKTAFQICFAFGLGIEEANDFLRRICLVRGFDCHSVEEVVYFFAVKNGLSYSETMDILKQVEMVKPGKMDKEDIVYTELIIEEIEELETTQELVAYLQENKEKFGYNNATAYEMIQGLWETISKDSGIAIREKKLLYSAFNKDVCENDYEDNISPKRKDRKRINDSIWEIFLQILGLSGDYVNDIYKDRSIKSIIKDNELLHPLAEDCFPDRDGLNKILNGEHVSYERVRKMLILLTFYRFWANKALMNQHYKTGYDDANRCIFTLNDNLIEAGYPTLYPGNPYDFIVLVMTNSYAPLLDFREYMREMFYEKMGMSDDL